MELEINRKNLQIHGNNTLKNKQTNKKHTHFGITNGSKQKLKEKSDRILRKTEKKKTDTEYHNLGDTSKVVLILTLKKVKQSFQTLHIKEVEKIMHKIRRRKETAKMRG